MFQKIVDKFQLGTLFEPVITIGEGNCALSSKITTSSGIYIVKEPVGPYSPQTLEKCEETAAEVAKHGIDTVVALSCDDHYVHKIGSVHYLIYPYIEGERRLLPTVETGIKAVQIAEAIHAINLSTPIWDEPVYQSYDILPEWNAEWVKVIPAVDGASRVSHGDIHTGNLIWSNNTYHLIDWAEAGRVHPNIEIMSMALEWSQFIDGPWDPNLFIAMIETYENWMIPPEQAFWGWIGDVVLRRISKRQERSRTPDIVKPVIKAIEVNLNRLLAAL